MYHEASSPMAELQRRQARHQRAGVPAMCLPGRSALLCLVLAISVPTLWASTASTDDRIYYVSKETASQSAAREICRRRGYDDLAILDTPERQRVAELAILAYNRTRRVEDVWLGASSPSMNGVYSWFGRGPITWSHWDKINDNEPDETSTQGCVRMKVPMDFLWATTACYYPCAALCEKTTGSIRSMIMEVLRRGIEVEGEHHWTGEESSRSRCFLRCESFGYHCLLVHYSGSVCTVFSTYQVTVRQGITPGSVLAGPLPDRM